MKRTLVFIKTVRSVILSLLVVSSSLMAQEGLYFNAAQGDKERVFNEMINEKIEGVGFKLTDAFEHVQESYKSKYSDDYTKRFDNLGFYLISSDEALRPLLLKEPRLGAFSPFNLFIYQTSDEDITRVGHLSPAVMLDIVGVKDMRVRKDFIKSFEGLDALIDSEIGGKREVVHFDKLPAKRLMEFELQFERPKDILDFVDEFQERFETVFDDNDFIIAGFKSFDEGYADRGEDFSRYDIYFVYSLCHFKFSYSIFNHGNAQAGVFAPCSMYMYIEKGSNVMKIGMPYLENWISVAGIKQKKQIDAIYALDKKIIKMMSSLGAELQ